MTTNAQIGRRLIPLEQIALIETFDLSTQTRMKSERPFQARVVMIDRDSVLTEDSVATLAERYGFRMLGDDGLATNPAVNFKVEEFKPSDGFEPTKQYKSRIIWRDHGGIPQSKLLLTEPLRVIAVAVRGEIDAPVAESPVVKTVRRIRRRAPAPTQT